MGLTKTQQMIWQKSRTAGTGDQAVGLSEPMCAYVVAVIARDLGLDHEFPEIPYPLPDFFSSEDFTSLVVNGVDACELLERLVGLDKDADMYYACLSTLHKARLKYQVILETQPIPTLEQVGPRSLLQFGQLSPRALAAFLFWRKWFFDIDNRAGQETGYLFEPVIAHAIGGIPVPARKSPVKRHRDTGKGRQVDCLRNKDAYELKIRVTIAASGQGRWREELDFPVDCKKSGHKPILVVLDATPNPKLAELSKAFLSQGGEVYVGDKAWKHLDDLAGPTMSRFLDKYVRGPINNLIDEATDQLPEMEARMEDGNIAIRVGDELLRISRREQPSEEDEQAIPDDVTDEIPG